MKEFKKIIICGTGRCGTKSMKCILENCQNCISTHEFNPILPWNFNEKEFKKRLNHFNNIKVKYYSDAGSWYLNYLERFIKEIPDIKIIILIIQRKLNPQLDCGFMRGMIIVLVQKEVKQIAGEKSERIQ